jgi:hypothetical protein
MKKISVILVCVILATACSSIQDSIIGSWTFYKPGICFTFDRNGRFVFSDPVVLGITRTGSYRFIENKKIKFTYDYESYVGSGKEEDRVVDIQNNKLTMYNVKNNEVVAILDRSDCQPKK